MPCSTSREDTHPPPARHPRATTPLHPRVAGKFTKKNSRRLASPSSCNWRIRQRFMTIIYPAGLLCAVCLLRVYQLLLPIGKYSSCVVIFLVLPPRFAGFFSVCSVHYGKPSLFISLSSAFWYPCRAFPVRGYRDFPPAAAAATTPKPSVWLRFFRATSHPTVPPLKRSHVSLRALLFLSVETFARCNASACEENIHRPAPPFLHTHDCCVA